MAEKNPDSGDGGFDSLDYDAKASAEAKSAMLIWLVAGAIYAAIKWHLLWLPAILLFMPGIFIASLLAALFFIPCYRLHAIVARDWRLFRRKRLGLTAAATILRILGLASPIAGAMLYVTLLSQVLPGEIERRDVATVPAPIATSPVQASSGAPFVVKCHEPIPEFTLGIDSHPTEAQVQQLCGCIWEHMNDWERETSCAIVEGRENDISGLNMRAFPSRFGQRVRECGGEDL